MARGPENRFILGVHRQLHSEVYRMKNHNEFNSGIADCWYSGNVGDLWVEYKYLELPKRGSTVISLVDGADPPLTALQQLWLEARHNEGRSVCVIVGTPIGGVWYPGLEWKAPLITSDFRGLLLSKRELANLIEYRTWKKT